MKKLVLTTIALGACLFTSVPASADAPVQLGTAHIRITRATNNCTAPGAGPKMYNYPCSYSHGVRDVPLFRNTVTATELPDHRIFHLTLKELTTENPRRFVVTAQHRKTAASEVLNLADIRARDNETFSFHFPSASGTEAWFLDISIN